MMVWVEELGVVLVAIMVSSDKAVRATVLESCILATPYDSL